MSTKTIKIQERHIKNISIENTMIEDITTTEALKTK
jgi:hypothetical protein